MKTKECECSFCGERLIRKVAPSIKSIRHFCNNGCKGNWQRAQKPWTREWLYEQYVTRGLNTTEIAHMVGRDPKSVWNWLKGFNIPTRPRGAASSPGTFHKGQRGTFTGKKHTAETRKRLSEIAKADDRIPYDPDVGSYMKGRKGKDAPGWKGGITPERQALYSSIEWKEAIKDVWERANAQCERCGIKHNTKKQRGTFHIHHIVSFATRELRTDIDNLALLCKKCHFFIHSKANVDSEFIKESDDAEPHSD